jgi:hypothetical protein
MRFRETGVEVVRDVFEPHIRERFTALGRRGNETHVGAEAALASASRRIIQPLRRLRGGKRAN